jgi:hypothetical protein
MATVESRYKAATDYVRRAIDVVESAPSILNVIDRYAARVKTESVRDALTQLEVRWLRASSDFDRANVGREAELLADRTKENLPGAPQDWTRTNLFSGERESSTPGTSYAAEFAHEADHDWNWASDKATRAAEASKGIGRWLFAGGGLLLALKLVDYLRERQGHQALALNDALERAADDANRRRAGTSR